MSHMSQPADRASPASDSMRHQWVTLADATRVTNRSDSTIKGWIASGLLKQPEEAHPTATPQGSGYVWAVSLAALERAHRAKGGIDWRPENIKTKAPAHIADELARLRDLVATLETQNRQLAAQLSALRGAGRVPLAQPPAPLAETGERASLREPHAGDLPLLPSGYRSLSSVNNAHGFGGGASAVIRGNHNFMERATLRGPWRHPNNYEVLVALDAEGMREYGRRWRSNKHFRLCNEPGCPVDAGARLAWSAQEERDGEMDMDTRPVPVVSARSSSTTSADDE